MDITPQDKDIELNIVPLDLVVQAGSSDTIYNVGSGGVSGGSPITINSGQIIKNIVDSGGGNIVKGFLKSQDFRTGSNGWILNGDGTVEFSDGTFRGSVTIGIGATIGGWVITANGITSSATEATANLFLDSTNSIIRVGSASGSYITIDGTNQRIRSSNYVTGVSGFTIEPNIIEAENIIARGTLRGSVFQYDIVNAVGGQLLVANADTLASDIAASDSSTLTTKGTTTWSVNDIIVMRAIATSGIQEEWMRITDISSAPTYTVTRDLAGLYGANANPSWKAGSPVVRQGSSDGASAYSGGWLRLFGEGTNSPYYSVFVRNGLLYNSYTEKVRMGNLNGIGGKVADCFGIFAGNSSTGNYLIYDDVSGDLIVNDSVISNSDIFGDGSDGDVTISVDTTLTSDVFYNNLTVNNGITLNTGGFRIFVKNTLTNNGTISRVGNAGSSASSKTHGSAGAALADGTIAGSQVGKDGTDGTEFSGTTGNATGSQRGNGSNQTNVIGNNGVAGGKGGNATTNPLAFGGAASTGGTATTSTAKARFSIEGVSLRGGSGGYDLIYANASSGAGSSGGCSNGTGVGSAISGGGGGSGSGGGAMVICAKKLINNGVITVVGGAGGNGGNATSDGSGRNGGGGGGGGGGNGGLTILIYSQKSGSGTYVITGGTKGNGGTKAGDNGGLQNGDNGIDGATGTKIELVV